MLNRSKADAQQEATPPAASSTELPATAKGGAGELSWLPSGNVLARCAACVAFDEDATCYECRLFVPNSSPEGALRKALIRARSHVEAASNQTYGGSVGDFIRDSAKADLAAIDAALSTASTAPAEPKAPAGWEFDRTSADTIIVNRPGLGGYVASADSQNIASSILYHLAAEISERPPAPSDAGKVPETLTSPLVQRVVDLHEKAFMPWNQAAELALSEFGFEEDELRELIGEFDQGLDFLASRDAIEDFARHVLVFGPDYLPKVPLAEILGSSRSAQAVPAEAQGEAESFYVRFAKEWITSGEDDRSRISEWIKGWYSVDEAASPSCAAAQAVPGEALRRARSVLTAVRAAYPDAEVGSIGAMAVEAITAIDVALQAQLAQAVPLTEVPAMSADCINQLAEDAWKLANHFAKVVFDNRNNNQQSSFVTYDQHHARETARWAILALHDAARDSWLLRPPKPAQAVQADAEDAAAGLSIDQEPKYTVNGSAIVNRASGEAIPADEPVFIFRARDTKALHALREYSGWCVDTSHRAAVTGRIQDFKDFAAAHPERMKEPDTDAARALPAQPAPKA